MSLKMISKNFKYPLLVLALYICTSGIFVLFFGVFYYQTKKDDILNYAAASLRDGARQIAYIRRIGGDIDAIAGFRGYDINLFNIPKNAYEIQEFNALPAEVKAALNYKISLTHDKGAKPKNNKMQASSDEIFHFKHSHSFILTKTHAYYLAFINKHSDILLLRTNVPIKAIDALYSRVLLLCALSFGVILVLSYFIVRLSYAPLLRHIKALDSFIADTTHEINTPLSVILMSLEMYEKNPSKYLANIKNAAFNLSQLFTDLSSTLKTQPLSLEMIEVSALIRERASFFELSASKKHLSFALDLAPFKLKSDRFRLSKIIDNLLSNAVKYSQNGEIIHVILQDNTLKVEQKGVVIKPKDMKKIYEKFARFDRTNGGFGIGLSLVKRFCDELGYTISANSSEQKTSFCIKFLSAAASL